MLPLTAGSAGGAGGAGAMGAQRMARACGVLPSYVRGRVGGGTCSGGSVGLAAAGDGVTFPLPVRGHTHMAHGGAVAAGTDADTRRVALRR